MHFSTLKYESKKNKIILKKHLTNPGRCAIISTERNERGHSKMTTMTLATIARTYTNNGQHAEQVVRFALTGKIEKADNKPATACGDCGDLQIKSARATICKGTDLDAHLATDAATHYAYVVKDFSIAYIMSKSEYREFASRFGTVTRESDKNGGAEKLRFGKESRAMREWLAGRA